MSESEQYSDVLELIKKQILTCSLCSQRFSLRQQGRLPICLDCSHTFCFDCLSQIRLGMGIFSTISCPTCHMETTAGVSGVNGLNRNETTIALINIIDSLKGILASQSRSTAETRSKNDMAAISNCHFVSSTAPRPQHHLDIVENVVITIAQYRRLVTDEKFRQIVNRAGCQIDLSIPHISVFSEPPPAVAIITFRGNQIQVNDGKSLFRKFLRDFRPHSFTTQATTSESFVPFVGREQANMITADIRDNSLKPSDQSMHIRQSNSFTGRAVSQSPFPDEEDIRNDVNLRQLYLKCDHDSIGNLLGARGGRIKELSHLTGCQLSVSSHDKDEFLDGDPSCSVKIVGTYDNISAGIPFIKSVLGRGDSAMHKVRQFYGSRHLQQLYQQQQQQQQQPINSLRQYQNSHRGNSLSRDNAFNNVAGEKDDSSTGGVSLLSPNEELSPPNVPGKKIEYRSHARRENFRAASPRMSPLNGRGNSNHDESFCGREDNGYNCDEVEEDENDDGDGDCDSNKSPLPYCLTPPSSPPPSSVFPGYFIEPGKDKNVEIVSIMRADADALFTSEGVTPQAIDLMQKCNCELTRLTRGDSSSDSIRITGAAVNREKAKYLLNIFRKDAQQSPFEVSGGLGTDEECITRYVDCPAHFIPVLIGAGGYTIEDLQIRTSTRILINEFRDEDQPPQICIIGTLTSVEEAFSCIDRMLVNHRFKYRQRPFSPSQRTRSLPSNPIHAFSSLPHSSVDITPIRNALSDGGPDVNHGVSILNRSESKSVESRHPETPPGLPHPGLSILQNNNTDRMRVATDKLSTGEDLTSTQLFCPGDKVSQLIGKKGSILRELKKITNCDISIERIVTLEETVANSSPPQLVHISGPSRYIEAAVKLVNEVIEVGPVIALNMETVRMVIPHDKVPLVIGQRGITAKEMMRRSGCKIHVNETVDADDNCFIELTGTSEQLCSARDLISDVLEYGTKALGKKFQK